MKIKELQEDSTCKNYLLVQYEGKKVQREVKVYNLQIVLVIGYHVRDNVGVHLREI